MLSDADEQLLLNVAVRRILYIPARAPHTHILPQFNQAVRVRSITIKSNDAGRAPQTIKLFTNRPVLGFEDVEDASEPEAAQIIDLSSDDVKEGKPITLRFVRFQAVNSLHVRQ